MAGYGIEFVHMKPEDREKLRRHISKLLQLTSYSLDTFFFLLVPIGEINAAVASIVFQK